MTDGEVYFHPQVRRVLANGVQWANAAGASTGMPHVTNPQRDWFVPAPA